MTDHTTTRAMNAAERLEVRSALNPALWLCGIVSVPALTAAVFMSDPPWWIIAMALGPVTIAGISYLILLFRDPDKLQSENYQLRKHALQVIEQKGGPLLTFDAEDIQLISNPRQGTIGSKGDAQ